MTHDGSLGVEIDGMVDRNVTFHSFLNGSSGTDRDRTAHWGLR